MRVGCNLLSLVPGASGGSETAVVSTLRHIGEKQPADVELWLYVLDAFADAYPDLRRRFPTRSVPLTGRFRPLRVAAENTWLAAGVRRDRIDLVHHVNAVLPVMGRVPGVVTVHDLQPFDMPGNFHPVRRTYVQRSVPRSVRRARLVLAPSEFVRQGIVDRFGVEPERVRAIAWGVDPPDNAVAVGSVQARYGLPRRWFVYNAITWPHKNHELLVRAFAGVAAREHDVMLVLIGGAAQCEDRIRAQIAGTGLRGRVRRTGRIPREDMLAIMRGAVALTFPSRYEGFGLPALEAMSLGTPVLAGDAAALPETVGDAGRLLDPDDAEAWSEAMLQLLRDGDERERLGAAGRARARSFSWESTARGTLAAYRDAGAQGADGEAGELEEAGS
ncbi:MAG TPA: glycosyltransferase family 1 protein [Acidimicrobiales bacterium]|jgi:alpha-1,3-rhamnosyl/mannosyltransferase|nr:glycosyltransferase family 1 protein [Acidimicrobiales bacterium]